MLSKKEEPMPFPVLKGTQRLVLAFLAAGPLLVLAPEAHAVTFTVTKTADTADGACDADCSLREAVIAANALAGDDDIILPAGTYTLTIAGAGENAAATGDLDITSNVTITGAGAATTIVNGGALDRVFDIRPMATTVAFSLVTITNGSVTGFGGGIDNNSTATVNITSSTISSNTCTGFGGGINNNSAGTVTVNSSTVSGNTAGGFGGGINNNLSGALTVTGTTVSGNTASGFGGGGINNNSSGMATVTGCIISSNMAQNGGGLNNNSSGPLTVANTTISGNSTTGGSIGGGGILNNSSGPLTVSASTISGNTGGGIGGGGIDNNSSGPATIVNSTVSGNTSTGTNGGGGVYKNFSGNVTLTNVTITGNSASVGGGIRNNNAVGAITLLNTIVANSPSGGNCAGNPVTSAGNNLSSDGTCPLGAAGDLNNTNPQLGPLANNGGPTQTHALLAGSPAIDAGSNTGCPATDQRGVARPQGPACDMGAFEFQLAQPTPTPTPTTGPPTPTPTVIPGIPSDIPTLSLPMLALLGLALAGIALFLLRRF